MTQAIAPQSPAKEIVGDPSTQENPMNLSDDPFVRHLPFIADRLGVAANTRIPGPTLVLPLPDGREYDIILMAHRALDLLEMAVGKSAAAIQGTQQVVQNLRGLQEQIIAHGGRIGVIEARNGIEPVVGPVPPPVPKAPPTPSAPGLGPIVARS